MTSIRESRYKDVPAVTIESDALRAQFLPAHGGKLASLYDKARQFEYLTQAPGASYRPLAYAGDYGAAECSGFDDMFPTIDPAHCHDHPWAGALLPDHGEVCGLPWSCEPGNDTLRLAVHGVRLPYRLEKTVRFEGEETLVIAYAAENPTPFPMAVLWAAHVMLNVEAGGRLLLPVPEGAPATWLFGARYGWPRYGEKFAWPQGVRRDGRTQDLRVTRPCRPDGDSYKFYVDGPLPEGWCGYEHPSRDARLLMRFPVATVPYLGVWMNEGSFHGLHNVALEPCTGTYDRPDLAALHGEGSVLPPRGRWTWDLSFTVAAAR